MGGGRAARRLDPPSRAAGPLTASAVARALLALAAALVTAAAAAGCRSTGGAEAGATASPAEAGTSPGAARRKVRLEPASPGPLAPIVAARAEAERADGRRLLVYVGAPWCEPCRRFHEAAAAGELDATLGDVTFLELDADADRERLATAGYVSRMVPLFALPSPEGYASGRQIEGSVKGDGAVAQIAPRLRALLATAR